MKSVVIGGGGLAGLTCAFLLRKAGFEVTLIERKEYPFHRVCGEYVSNEVIPFLTHHGIFPDGVGVARISKFLFSSVSGRTLELPLDLGGFGISRFKLDDFLYRRCLQSGVQVLTKTQIKSVQHTSSGYRVELSDGKSLLTPLYLAAHGKSSNLDKGRRFMLKPAGYVGVKYHLKLDFADDVIALHNFEGGYCGISKIESDTYNLCYLTTLSQLKRFVSIERLERECLHVNPHLRQIWRKATFIFDNPLVITNFSFVPKRPVENGILMMGDAAGLITPLCGNGMALAFRSAALAAQVVEAHYGNLPKLLQEYSALWKAQFANRLWIGRNLQALFGRKWQSEAAVTFFAKNRIAAQYLMSLTHGKPMMTTAG